MSGADQAQQKCGVIAIVGRPNVGKSTLMNRILGEKLSITSRKPQTTRHRLLGIKTMGSTQMVYVDTPGIHSNKETAMNRYLNRAATGSIEDVDMILFVVDGEQWNEEDSGVIELLKRQQCPVVAVINKVDQIADKELLLPILSTLAERYPFTEIVPLSALKGKGVDRLEQRLESLLPDGPHIYEEDQITDRSERFLVAERIREKLTRQLGQELPYALTVEIEQFKEDGKMTHIAAVIWVERAGQKGIVIGKKGARLRSVGKEAREELEELLQRKIFLQLWVKVRAGWSDDDRALQSLGYKEELH
ncbi:MAG: GTPase Era [Gammaproteobacteria bacterium]|jgi:GTP-binding protein Era|nr:GTPase Era [Gammaproteobacteria bacterium]MBT3488948.1 GTPase Era [Gammaproteobacteria bacterium]MBT3719393.1 GTPase Era [Gammaproteobacteria bacterium]MBT3844560.1 GTPase Era [Gammaproteobacteria bacterium]MBT3893771.1 GTPase Era [Gammaproteobacteria bacterium]